MRKVHSQHRPCPSPHSHPLFLLLRPPFRPTQSEQRVLNQSQRRPAARHHTPLLVPLLRLPSPRRVPSSALLFSNHFLQTNTQRVQHSQQPNHFLLVSLSTRPLAHSLHHSPTQHSLHVGTRQTRATHQPDRWQRGKREMKGEEGVKDEVKTKEGKREDERRRGERQTRQRVWQERRWLCRSSAKKRRQGIDEEREKDEGNRKKREVEE